MTVSTGAGNMEAEQGVGGELSVQWWPDPFSHSPISKETFCERSSVQALSRVRLFETPWTAACQTSVSITNSQNLLKLMSIELVMPSNHLIHCCPLLLLSSIFPSIRVFSKESVLHIRWPKCWNFSFSIGTLRDWQRR